MKGTKSMFIKLSIWAMGSLAILLVTGDLAWPKEGEGKKPNDTKAAVTAPVSPSQREADISGFRSVRFGMNEKDVEKAVNKDFPNANITRSTHPVEKTLTLAVTVQDLFPESGPAQVGYILGHKSQALIQVNVLWSKAINPKSDNATLVAIANELKNYFVLQGFESDKMVVNVTLPDGSILVFRGVDKKGHMVALLLGPVQDQKTTEKTDMDFFLRLSYFENPVAPDIFQIKQGDF